MSPDQMETIAELAAMKVADRMAEKLDAALDRHKRECPLQFHIKTEEQLERLSDRSAEKAIAEFEVRRAVTCPLKHQMRAAIWKRAALIAAGGTGALAAVAEIVARIFHPTSPGK